MAQWRSPPASLGAVAIGSWSRPSPEPAGNGTSGGSSPYDRCTAVLATKHDKQDAVASGLDRTGLVVVTVAVDTDALGTFTGEVPRPGPPLDTAVAKARLGMAATGWNLGLASEGSFDPHPGLPWVTLHHELVVLVDDRRGWIFAGTATSTTTVTVTTVVGVDDALDPVLERADLPLHALIVRPNEGRPSPLHKGLRRPEDIRAAVAEAARCSPDGRARLETDLRAHQCPSRVPVIAAAAADLAARLSSFCPSCSAPGWAPVQVVRGVPCEWCGLVVSLPRAEILGCIACDHRWERPLEAVAATADPGQCPNCNP
jgi:hypothetical protein